MPSKNFVPLYLSTIADEHTLARGASFLFILISYLALYLAKLTHFQSFINYNWLCFDWPCNLNLTGAAKGQVLSSRLMKFLEPIYSFNVGDYLSGLEVFYCFLNNNRQRCWSNVITSDSISRPESCHKSLVMDSPDHAIGWRATHDAWKIPSFSFTTICFSTKPLQYNSLVVTNIVYWFFLKLFKSHRA